jgi:hypothetical protein
MIWAMFVFFALKNDGSEIIRIRLFRKIRMGHSWPAATASPALVLSKTISEARGPGRIAAIEQTGCRLSRSQDIDNENQNGYTRTQGKAEKGYGNKLKILVGEDDCSSGE